MPGLRERKRRKTFATIHHAAMRLFAERGYSAVTIADIADAAEVSRATVFAYYRAKEDIVLGDAPLVLDMLKARLEEAAPRTPVLDTVREWLGTLTGWVEPDILLQRRLARDVPAVDAARSRLIRAIETIIADALAREMGVDRPLAPRLVAASLTAALITVEDEAAERIARGHQPLAGEEIDELLDQAFAFITRGLDGISD
jgi:AcrR family transcriptional regulator